jgi:HAD superfamily hydrolase (TIGR01457 family)
MNVAEPAYQGYIFDLDGTVYLSDRLLPGAQERIASLRAAGCRVVFLSNKPLEPRGNYAAKLTRLGIETPGEDVINSTQSLVGYLRRERPGKRLYVIGEDLLLDELRSEGLTVVSSAAETDIVVASFDRTLSYAKLDIAYQALVGGAEFVATNADMACPVEGGAIPDCAGVIAFLEATTGCRCALVAGKPSSLILDAALQRLGVGYQDALMVGDRLSTDIRMGVKRGMDTALVLTGVTTRDDLVVSDVQPTMVLDTIGQVP